MHLRFSKDLSETMKTCFTQCEKQFEIEKNQVESRLDKLLQSELSKDIKTNPESLQILTKNFYEDNKIIVHDPLNLEEKIKSLDQEIENFELNIDWKLSEANGKNIITF